jgi:hypothetical protein
VTLGFQKDGCFTKAKGFLRDHGAIVGGVGIVVAAVMVRKHVHGIYVTMTITF